MTSSTAVCNSLLNTPYGFPAGELELEVLWLGSDNYIVQKLTCKGGATRKVYATAIEIQELILKEREKGKTVFLTTHNMAEAEKLCNHVALLNEGSIIEYGEPKEICRRYNHQKRIQLHLTDGSDIELPHDTNAGQTLSDYFNKGIIETIHSTEPNLETVFMELTGRTLN